MRLRRPVCVAAVLLFLSLLIMAEAGGSLLPRSPSPEAERLREDLAGGREIEALVRGRVVRYEKSEDSIRVWLASVSTDTGGAAAEEARAADAQLSKGGSFPAKLSSEQFVTSSETVQRISSFPSAEEGSVPFPHGQAWGQEPRTASVLTSVNNSEYTAVTGLVTENPRVRILVWFERGESTENACHIGSRIEAEGVLYQPAPTGNPGEFDMRSYDEARNILCRMKKARLLSAAYRPGPLDLLFGWFARAGDILDGIAGEDGTGLARAILLGDKSSLDDGASRLFREGGIAHVLAVSGLHISFFGMSLFRLLRRRRCSYAACFLVSSAAVLFYTEMTGGSVSAMRAAVMFLVWAGGQLLGRSSDALTSLSVAGVALLLLYPGNIRDSGFYLSFACILSVRQLYPLVRSAISVPDQSGEEAASAAGGGLSSAGGVNVSGRGGLSLAGEVSVSGRGSAKDHPERREKAVRLFGRLRDDLLVSVCVSAGTLPVLCGFFYCYAPWSVLLNLIVLPLMPVIMTSALAAAAAGFFHAGAGAVLYLPARGALRLILFLCRVEARLPFAQVITGRPPAWKIFVYYLFLLFVCVWLRHGRRKDRSHKMSEGRRIFGGNPGRNPGGNPGRNPGGNAGGKAGGQPRRVPARPGRRLPLILFLIFGTLLMNVHGSPDFRVTFLNVGQGDCILLEMKGHVFLTDCGSSSVTDVWNNRVIGALRCYGISRLDAVFLTHGDTDHVNGIEQMMEDGTMTLTGRFRCGGIDPGRIITAKGASTHDRILGEVVTAAERKGIPTGEIGPGGCIRGGDGPGISDGTADAASFQIMCVYPEAMSEEAWEENAGNETSLVLYVTYGGYRLLLTGDLEKEGELQFLESFSERFSPEERRIDLLKAGHHGSRFATSEELLEVLRPECAVISCGKNNLYGHPAPAMLERLKAAGCAIFRTDTQGAVTAEADRRSGRLRLSYSLQPTA